jgi:16S rRNA (guanine(527)-N(7))-methyltransferase RsmG
VNRSPAKQLQHILRGTEKSGGDPFSEAEIDRLASYYGQVLKWNKRLHLTTITKPQAFFDRHIREAEIASARIPNSINRVWDLGAGLGIPGIAIAILRPQIEMTLVDSNRAKAIYLEEVISQLQLTNAVVTRQRVERLKRLPREASVTVRALERMEQMIPVILEIASQCRQILIFGNPRIEDLLRPISGHERRINSYPISGSERRILFEILRST